MDNSPSSCTKDASNILTCSRAIVLNQKLQFQDQNVIPISLLIYSAVGDLLQTVSTTMIVIDENDPVRVVLEVNALFIFTELLTKKTLHKPKQPFDILFVRVNIDENSPIGTYVGKLRVYVSFFSLFLLTFMFSFFLILLRPSVCPRLRKRRLQQCVSVQQ